MSKEKKIAELIAPSLESMGYELVRVMFVGPHGKRSLQIMADKADGDIVDVEDCTKISKTVSALLDVEDIIKEKYTLEVSSPGIDRPLTRPKDFVRFAGFDVKIETDTAIGGQKNFKGRLTNTDEESVSLESDDGSHIIPLASIHRAKLLMTDDLLKAVQEKQV